MYIEGASTFASQFDLVMNIVHLSAIIPFILLNGVLVYFIIRYRKRSDNDKTSKLDDSFWLEFTWTAVPTIVLMILFYLGLTSFQEMRSAPKDAMEINVWAKQWAWEFQYPASLKQDAQGDAALKSFKDLYLEEGKPVKLIMKSRDVIHSFFVPAFRVKEDIVGNIYTYVSFTPIISESQASKGYGEYNLFCAEYCGKDHLPVRPAPQRISSNTRWTL